MDLADILGREQIVPELKATNRWEAIDELIGNLVATGKIQAADRDAVTAAVKKRETSMSTGIGFGIGIPHASTDLIFEVVGVFPNHLKHVLLLSERIPNLKMVLDHLAKPPIKEKQMSPWSDQLKAAAENPR